MNADNSDLIDTHCHLDNPLLFAIRSEIISAAGNCGVKRFIVPGVEPQNWNRIMLIATENQQIFAAPGVHPLYAGKYNNSAIELLKKLTSANIVAIGEIGLDYSKGMPPRELQKEVFRTQLQIARDASLPVIIHCRNAFADTLKILAEEQIEKFGGVMHAFSGSVEIARTCITMGLKIGIGGPVTWNNAVRPVTIVREIPLQHFLLETDSPDLSPEPHRGEINEPAFLLDIVQKIANIKGITTDYVARITTETAKSTFPMMRIAPMT